MSSLQDETATPAGPAGQGSTIAAPAIDRRDDPSPFGIGSSEEWAGEFPRFLPLARQAGMAWVRLWSEWQEVQPAMGEWNWARNDRLIEEALRNGMRVTGEFLYFAPWASRDGKDSRAFPISDLAHWREYVRRTVERYGSVVKHWEVWNEFNSPVFNRGGSPRHYAELVREAHRAAKEVDPDCRIGMTCAGFDVGFIDQAIREGAAGHFDFVCVHPYDVLGSVMYGNEAGFLALASTLRAMLASHGQDPGIRLWISEAGEESPVRPDKHADRRQAEALIKLYVLGIAQGFERIFWFEARGPSYGHGRDFGLIREDWSLRPAHAACATITHLLGAMPAYEGWLEMGSGIFALLFAGRETDVLVVWGSGSSGRKVAFTSPLVVVEAEGRETALPPGVPLRVDRMPVYLLDLPADLVALARGNVHRPFPWGGHHGGREEVAYRPGDADADSGLQRILFRADTENRTVATESGGRGCLRVLSVDRDQHCAYFRVHPSFAGFGEGRFRITVTARSTQSGAVRRLGITYESTTAYRAAEGLWEIPSDGRWHESSWTIDGANFIGRWSWNLGLRIEGDCEGVYLGDVRVRKVG